MTESREDREIRVAFEALRQVDRGQAPEFQRILGPRPPFHGQPGKRIWFVLAGSVAVFALLWLLFDQRLPGRKTQRFEQTAALLSDSLLQFIPQPGLASPGSPLRALDPGEPLGPSLERSLPQ
ncbi:MAG: hypothetical protein ACT4PM_10440 [Gemmatimonadales bacterium]